MPKVSVELTEQDIKGIIFRTKKSVSEGVLAIIRDYLKKGIDPQSLADDEKFIKTLEEMFEIKVERLTAQINKTLKELEENLLLKQEFDDFKTKITQEINALKGRTSRELKLIKEKIQSLPEEHESEKVNELSKQIQNIIKEIEDIDLKVRTLQSGLTKEMDNHRLRIANLIDKEIGGIRRFTEELDKILTDQIRKVKKLESRINQGVSAELGRIRKRLEDEVLPNLLYFETKIKGIEHTFQALYKEISDVKKRMGIQQTECSAIHRE